jgi:transposase
MDYEGIKTLLRKADEQFPRLSHLWLDAGNRGEDKGKDWALRRPWGGVPSSSSAPKACSQRCALMAWAREWAKEGVAVDRKGSYCSPRGFQVLPRRWVVERMFSWIEQNRRMSKDYEKPFASSEAFVYAAMSRLMVRRLIRA